MGCACIVTVLNREPREIVCRCLDPLDSGDVQLSTEFLVQCDLIQCFF